MLQEYKEPNRAVIILGMHRSGTSALTGSLQQAGLHLGEVSTFSPDNLKGNRESSAIMTLHDDLLTRSSGSWKNPPARVEWLPIHYAFQQIIIQQLRSHSTWGFKDPRTVLTLGPWLKVLPDAMLVGVFRHPSKVIESLNARNGIPLAQGLELWITYNRILLWHHEHSRDFPLIEFGENENDFRQNINFLREHLSLTDNKVDFYDNTLNSNSALPIDRVEHASVAMKLYDKLRNRAHVASNL